MRFFSLVLSLVGAASLQFEMAQLLDKLTRTSFLFPHEYSHYVRVRNDIASLPMDSYPGFYEDLLRLSEILGRIEVLSGYSEKKA